MQIPELSRYDVERNDPEFQTLSAKLELPLFGAVRLQLVVRNGQDGEVVRQAAQRLVDVIASDEAGFRSRIVAAFLKEAAGPAAIGHESVEELLLNPLLSVSVWDSGSGASGDLAFDVEVGPFGSILVELDASGNITGIQIAN